MNKETKDTLKKGADYAGEEKKNLAKKMHDMTAGAAVLWAVLVLNLLYSSGVLEKIRAKKAALLNK